jgi:hypothetical protein
MPCTAASLWLAPTAGTHGGHAPALSPLAPHERFSPSAPRKPPSRLIPTNPSSRRPRSPIGTRRHSQVLAAMAGWYVARVMESIGLLAACWSRAPGGSSAWRWAAAPGGSPPPALHNAPRSPPGRLFLLLNSHGTWIAALARGLEPGTWCAHGKPGRSRAIKGRESGSAGPGCSP